MFFKLTDLPVINVDAHCIYIELQQKNKYRLGGSNQCRVASKVTIDTQVDKHTK